MQPGEAPARSARYFDYTGTGNSLNVRHPNVLQLIMDSLRHWVLEMHVDGFRFDAHHEPLVFTLPTRDWGDRWVTVLDTSAPLPEESDRIVTAGEHVQLRDRSIMLLRRAD